MLPVLAVVKSALDDNNLCLAQIAALRSRLSDLPDFFARAHLENEDLQLKAERDGDILARGGWETDEHPRAGVPPNPGWFASIGGASSTGANPTAQGAEERPVKEMPVPLVHRLIQKVQVCG